MKILSVVFALILLSGCQAPESPREFVLPIGTKDQFMGSAVVIAPGKLVTAAHVAKRANAVLYKGVFVPITKIYNDEKNDITVMQAVGVECPCVPVQNKTPAIDEEVIKVGFALYPEIKVQNMTKGHYQGTGINDKGLHFFIYTATSAPGDSGGGIFVQRGGKYFLIGIVSAISTYDGSFFPMVFPDFAWGIPIELIKGKF